MSDFLIEPSTLDGIKRSAKTIGRKQGLSHHEALDQAARKAGYQNLRDAQRKLVAAPSSVRHAVYLTAYWRTREWPIRAGRETLRVLLTQPLDVVIPKKERGVGRHLGAFRLEAADHLERRLDLQTQKDAQESLLAAVRALQFIIATGLHPVSTPKQEAAIDVDGMPDHDHVSTWIDTSGAVVKLDEPYRDVVALQAARASWLAARSLVMIAPAWEGLYAPGYSHPFFVLRDEALGRRLQQQVETLARQPVLRWNGVSASYADRFVSPARMAEGKPASRRTMPALPGTMRNGAIAYGGQAGRLGRWRPAVPMAVALHEQASTLIQSMNEGRLSLRAARHLQQVRSTLENWLVLEHSDAYSQRADPLYYGGKIPALTVDQVPLALETLMGVLREGYAECAPRRQLLARLEQMRRYL